jgi:hypothetical protein
MISIYVYIMISSTERAGLGPTEINSTNLRLFRHASAMSLSMYSPSGRKEEREAHNLKVILEGDSPNPLGKQLQCSMLKLQ